MSFGPMAAERLRITDDAALGGRLKLLQPERGHRFGHDAILLAASVAARPGESVVELGAGVGAAALALLARVPRARAVLVEIDPALSALAAKNIARNGFQDRARAVTLDVAGSSRDFSAAGLAAGIADHVLMNPPFNDAALQSSPDRLRRKAHAASDETLATWIRAASRLLRPKGHLTLIWRSDGLAQVLAALADGFGAVEIVPVHPAADKPAIRVIVTAIKGAEAPLSLRPALILNAGTKPTRQAEAILRHAKALNETRAATRPPGHRVAARKHRRKR